MNKHLAGAKWKVLVGCAPCQPFFFLHGKSPPQCKKYGQLESNNNFMDKIKEINPDVVSMENVPHITNATGIL